MGVSVLAYSPDGRYLAAGSGDGSVMIYNTEDGCVGGRLPLPYPCTLGTSHTRCCPAVMPERLRVCVCVCARVPVSAVSMSASRFVLLLNPRRLTTPPYSG